MGAAYTLLTMLLQISKQIAQCSLHTLHGSFENKPKGSYENYDGNRNNFVDSANKP